MRGRLGMVLRWPCSSAASQRQADAYLREFLARYSWLLACRPHRTTCPSERTRSFASTGSPARSEEHTSELQSLMRISYAVFCLKKKTNNNSKQKTSYDVKQH